MQICVPVSLAQLVETMHNICKIGVQTPTITKKKHANLQVMEKP